MKYYLFVIGCQMNLSDAERIKKVLDDLGYTETKEEKEADLLMAVACSVRQKAADRIYGKIRNWNRLKKIRQRVTILTGCVLAADQKKCLKLFDFYFPIKDLNKLPRLLKKHLPPPTSGRPAMSDAQPAFAKAASFAPPAGGATKAKPAGRPATSYFQIHPTYQSGFHAYVPIMTGCDNFCTYCAVPYTRGREISRPKKEIIQEIKNLLSRGYKEITLLGQNVNSYGSLKDKNNQPFIDLLKAIDRLPGSFRLRFLTNHPKDMSKELIEALPKSKKFCHYLHLPLQAGDNAILKKMNRPYTAEKYLGLIRHLKKVMPDLALSTDIIVGFPSETEIQFKKTASLMRKIRFDMAYLAQYSPRPATVASRLTDNVLKKDKKRREEILNEILKKTALANNRKLIGRTAEVLVEKSGSEKTPTGQSRFLNFGKTEGFKNIKFLSDRNLAGRFVKIKVVSANPWSLTGELIK